MIVDLRPAKSGGYRVYYGEQLIGDIYFVDHTHYYWPHPSKGSYAAPLLEELGQTLARLDREHDQQRRLSATGPSTECSGRNYVPSPDTGVPWDDR